MGVDGRTNAAPRSTNLVGQGIGSVPRIALTRRRREFIRLIDEATRGSSVPREHRSQAIELGALDIVDDIGDLPTQNGGADETGRLAARDVEQPCRWWVADWHQLRPLGSGASIRAIGCALSESCAQLWPCSASDPL